MSSRLLRACAPAVFLWSACAAWGTPVAMDFEGTAFEAEMGYNTDDPGQWPTTQSEPSETPPDGLAFPNADALENLLSEGGDSIDQVWSVLASQSTGGGGVPRLHFTFHRVFASPVLPTFPAMLRLYNLNTTDLATVNVAGPIEGTFRYGDSEEYDWQINDQWTWEHTGGGEHELEIELGTLVDEFTGLPSGAEIWEIDVEFNLLPEPALLMGLAPIALLVLRKRR